MTDRQRRLLRLTELREKQHDRAVVNLRALHGQLHAATAAKKSAIAQVQTAHAQRNAALADAEAEVWLLACAEAEIAAIDVVGRIRGCNEAEQEVADAAECEAMARRDLRQMERTLERMRQEDRLLSSRREQKELDECAQLLRIRLSKRTSALAQP